MKLKYLIGAAAAASALLAGASYAQTTYNGAHVGTTANSGTTNSPDDQSTPTAGLGQSGATSQSTSGSMSGSMSSGTDVTSQSNMSSSTSTDMSSSATSATGAGQDVSVTNQTVTNGPVPDTPENRAKYGGPMSRAGKHTRAAGN